MSSGDVYDAFKVQKMKWSKIGKQIKFFNKFINAIKKTTSLWKQKIEKNFEFEKTTQKL